jgi:hypothetical protein
VSGHDTYVMVLEGVLVGIDDRADLRREAPDVLGQSIYRSLSAGGRLVLATRTDRRVVEHWLRLYNLGAHGGVETLSATLVDRLRASGEDPTLYVDHDGERAAGWMAQGVAVAVVARPLYARLQHRPDISGGDGHVPRPWTAIAAEQRSQNALRERPVLDLDERMSD